MTIVQNPWPFSHLLVDEVKSSRPATANVARTLAGNVALAQAMTAGGDLVDGAPSIAPMMGHGTRGHDHSGGAGGAPLFRDIASVPLGGGDTLRDLSFITPGSGFVFTGIPSQPASTMSQPVSIAIPRPALWIPPCSSDGAYVDMRVRMSLQMNSIGGPLFAGDSLLVNVFNETPSVSLSSNQCLLTFTGVAGIKSAVSDSPLKFVPGTYNRIRFIVRFQTSADVGNRQPRVGWYSVSAGILSL